MSPHPCHRGSQELPQPRSAGRRRVLPHRQQLRLLALARPRATGDTWLSGSYLSLLPGRRGARHQHRGFVGLAGSEQSRKTGARAGSGCREQVGRPVLPRCREELHGFGSSHGHLTPALPRAAALAAGTAQTRQPCWAPSEQRFPRLCRGNSAQEFARRRTFPTAQRVDPEPSVFQQWPAQIQPRTERPVPERVGGSRDGRARRVPAPLRHGPRRQASSRALSRRCPVPPPSDGRSAGASP